MKKKIVAMVLAITMIAALVLSSCSAEQKPSESTAPGNSDAAAVESEGPITFTMMYRDSPNYPFDANWPALKAIQAEKDVNLDIRTVPSKDYASKLRVILNSGDIPDFITGVDKDIVTEFSSSGVLLRVSDYLDKLPNFKARVEQYGIADELDNWYSQDGGLYALPVMNESFMYNTAPAIRVDLLEEYQLEIPTTYDELYQVLKTIKENRPNTYPMANYNGSNNIRTISGPSWGIEGSYNGFMYDEAKGEYYYANISEEYQAYTRFLNKMVAEGLAAPEIYTATVDQWRQKVVKVYGNLMVDVQPSNEKLVRRCVHIVCTAAECSEEEAAAALEACGYQAKTAIIMILLGISAQEAKVRLDAAGGRIARVLAR